MRPHAFVTGEYYHLYSRGIEKRIIFMDESDHLRFLKLLFFCNSSDPVNIREIPKGLTFGDFVYKRERLIDIGAYCLMPNHFHILIKERQDSGVSLFMQKILTAYTMYFNVKYERTGRLFESTFKSSHANYDKYLKYLFAYIHLNPLKLLNPKWKEERAYKKKDLLGALEGYKYSSLLDYLGVKRDESNILNREEFPDYFTTSEDFYKEIVDWMDLSSKIPEV